MPPINATLLAKIQKRLTVSERQAYALIAKKQAATHLPRHLAAVALAAEVGINTSMRSYATDEERDLIRSAAHSAGVARPNRAGPAEQPTPRESRSPARAVRRRAPSARKSNSVMVVHGRNLAVRDAMYTFLRALGLNPIEYSAAIKATRKGAPDTRDVLDVMFKNAAAVVVLLTPDDEARLQKDFWKPSDAAYEKRFTGQSRPNVLFEAGRAFGSHPDATILVQVGKHRPFSDTAGVQVVHIGADAASRQDLANRLESAGCAVDQTGTHWLTAGVFKA